MPFELVEHEPDPAIRREAERLVAKAKASRLAKVGDAIPLDWDRAVEATYPTVWKPYKVAVPKGWIDLVVAFSEHLSKVSPLCYVEDSKEKFGTLRLSVTGDAVTREVWDLEGVYEAMSMHVCEDCGEPGTYRSERAWVVTLCDRHAAERDQG